MFSAKAKVALRVSPYDMHNYMWDCANTTITNKKRCRSGDTIVPVNYSGDSHRFAVHCNGSKREGKNTIGLPLAA